MVGGQDKFGRFKLFTTLQSSTCDNCGAHPVVVLQYYPRQPKLPEGIKPEDTILGRSPRVTKPGRTHQPNIGVTCGCYAKGHRQIAHIEERMKQRDQ